VDSLGDPCEGTVRVGVVFHDQSEPFDPAMIDAADDGPLFDSTIPGNQPPQAIDDQQTTLEDTPLTLAAPGVLANDTDLDGEPLTATLLDAPANGTLTLQIDGGFSYTPTPNFNGTDIFTYQASDGTDVSTATVTISVEPVNDLPVAVDDANTTDEDTVLVVPADNGVLANDSDADGHPLIVTAVNDAGANVGSQITLPSGALLRLNSDGSYEYNPNDAFNLAAGETATDSFSYTINDGNGGTDTAIVTLTIGGFDDNQPPDAVDDAAATDEDTPLATIAVLSNDTDPDNDPLSVVSFDASGATGLVSNNGDGTFSYDPNGQFEDLATGETAIDSFSYTIDDGNGGNDTATVVITINGIDDNNSPDAVDDAAITDEDTPLAAITVLSNDTDADGDTLTVVGFDASGAAGLVSDNGDGTFGYDPNGQFEDLATGETATDSFSYTIDDGNGGTDTATVTITINGVDDNSSPDADDDAYTMNKGETLNVESPGVLSNDTDGNGDSLSVTAVNGDTNAVGAQITLASGAALRLNGDGSFTFTPTPNFRGEDSFTYTIDDGNGGSDIATVLITILKPNE
jgi:VCBS repeat-containing protein